jgi:hypothetical protein
MKKIVREMTRMKDERSRLRVIMSQYMGEDLVPLSLQDVTDLEQQLELSLYKVRLRKVIAESRSVRSTPCWVILGTALTPSLLWQQELLDQQLLEMRHRVCRIPFSSVS